MAFAVGGPTKGKPRPVPTINVTPLVDVILVVLIIFMLVTPMMMKTFWLNVPKAATEEQQQQQDTGEVDEAKKPLVMTVDQRGAISINKHPIDAAELASKLPRLLAAKENKVLYFDAHDDAPYGAAARAMDLSRAAGAQSIAIMTQSVVR